MKDEARWQLKMFKKTLKKNQRLRALRRHLGHIDQHQHCLLVTCGDNNGAMNYYLRETGGNWAWADLEDTCIDEMSDLLGEPVLLGSENYLPFPDLTFDRVVTIDVHEHLDNPAGINDEIFRISKPGAQIIITVPNGDESKLAVRIKHAIGMTPEVYGHARIGLESNEITQLMRNSGIEPRRHSSFSRFFTEILELTINFAYVKLLPSSKKPEFEQGQIAPATQTQLKSVKKVYFLYSSIFPIYWLISKLDRLLFFREGYCVVVEGIRQP